MMKLIETETLKSSEVLGHAARVISEIDIREDLGFCIIETDSSGDVGLLAGSCDYGIYLKPEDSLTREEVSEAVFTAKSQKASCHIVWLSSKAFQLPPIKFSWVMAHELGHVLQKTGSRPIIRNFRQVVDSYRRSPPYMGLPNSCMHINEIDSDLLAYETCGNIFSRKVVDEYISSHPIERCPFNQYHALLKEISNVHRPK